MSEDDEENAGRNVDHALLVESVLLTQRMGILTLAMLLYCELTMRSVCRQFGAELLEFDGGSDRVRIVVQFPPAVAVSRLIGSLKSVSSRLLHHRFPELEQPIWSRSYSARTLSGRLGGLAAAAGEAPE
jgi:putative transposase